MFTHFILIIIIRSIIIRLILWPKYAKTLSLPQGVKVEITEPPKLVPLCVKVSKKKFRI